MREDYVKEDNTLMMEKYLLLEICDMVNTISGCTNIISSFVKGDLDIDGFVAAFERINNKISTSGKEKEMCKALSSQIQEKICLDKSDGKDPLARFDDYEKEIHCVISYTPGGRLDVMYSPECDEMIYAHPEDYMCIGIPDTKVMIVYNKKTAIRTEGKVLTTEPVMFFAADDDGEYSEIDDDALSLVLEYIIESQAQITCYGELIHALGVPGGRCV